MSFPDIPGYQIQEEIGKGSMGVVYRARHLALDRVVALKVLNPQFSQDEEFVRSFSQEAKTVARLSHPNIVTVHDFGSHEGLYFLTMQFVHGRTLRELLAIRRPNPLECAQILLQIAEALDYAHREEVIHRDVKPGNIMLCPDGKAMIMDFGVASGYFAGSGGDVWVMAGSPAYMSAEQCKGQKASPRSDQYALGVTLYEMVTGRLPFPAKDSNAVRRQHISEAPPPLRLGRTDITPRMEAAVLRALSKISEMRFVTVSDFVREFETACQERPASDVLVGAAPAPDAPAPSATPVSLIGGEKFASRARGTHSGVVVAAVRSTAESRRRRSLLVVLLLLVLCGGGGAAAYFNYFRTPPPVVTKPKKAKKPVKGKTNRSGSRANRSGGAPTTLHPDPVGSDTPPPTKDDTAVDTEEPTTDVEHPAEPEDPPADDQDTEKKGAAEGKGEGEE